MADQVNPMGGLAPGLPLPLLVAAAPRPAPESPRPSKATESVSQGTPGNGGRVSKESVQTAMDQVNNRLQEVGTQLKFQVDAGTGHTVFKIVDPDNGKVLIQVPSEEMLALARNLRAMDKQASSSGTLVDKEG